MATVTVVVSIDEGNIIGLDAWLFSNGGTDHGAGIADYGPDFHATGIFDGTNRHATGIFDGTNRHATGIFDGTNRHATGIFDGTNRHADGIFDATTRYATGVFDTAGGRNADGVLYDSGGGVMVRATEASRNSDPGEANVLSGTSYNIGGASKTGTMVGGGGNRCIGIGM